MNVHENYRTIVSDHDSNKHPPILVNTYAYLCKSLIKYLCSRIINLFFICLMLYLAMTRTGNRITFRIYTFKERTCEEPISLEALFLLLFLFGFLFVCLFFRYRKPCLRVRPCRTQLLLFVYNGK